MCVTSLPVCTQMFVSMQVLMHMEEESAEGRGVVSWELLGWFILILRQCLSLCCGIHWRGQPMGPRDLSVTGSLVP